MSPPLLTDSLPSTLCNATCKKTRRLLDRMDTFEFCYNPMCDAVQDPEYLCTIIEKAGNKTKGKVITGGGGGGGQQTDQQTGTMRIINGSKNSLSYSHVTKCYKMSQIFNAATA